ncbi:MAG: 16S rRNA (guanine(966)-N(2))-methyltransferase RsmD [Spirochaetales bacterium]|nr:16S rRNA (guanine(966)-N(2))-methyltransferase RsmD [Spirochaetales bacterium]
MRITGGIYCGRRISCPPGVIRPAMDRMRTSVFAILGDLSGCSFIDLFSGSGVIGIEAASRGAEPVILVEKDYKKKAVMAKNTAFVTSRIEIHMIPVMRFLKRFKGNADYIFLDPPFNLPGKAEYIEKISGLELLNDNGTVIIHAPQEDILPENIGHLKKIDLRKYGRSIVHFFR